jgi:hypothetical protein
MLRGVLEQIVIGPGVSGQGLVTYILGSGQGTKDRSINEVVRMTEDTQELTLVYQCLKNRLESVLYFRANQFGGKI